jgi:ribosomal protein S6--L-glutamate ligase
MSAAPLHLGFILEEEYRNSRMPTAVTRALEGWGHHITLLEPRRALGDIDRTVAHGGFDAVVLRTVSGGPGLSLLQAFAASGVKTINAADAVTRVRDKMVMAASARAHGIPFPETYFVTDARLMEQIPEKRFPLVVKPSVGGFGRAVRLVQTREELAALDPDGRAPSYLVAQPWVANSGYDIKLYDTGQHIHAVRRHSSLLGGLDGEREPVPVTDAMRELAHRIGGAFGLDIHGADVVEGEEGWVVVDVNDFPSFGTIAEAPREVAATVVELARGNTKRRKSP